jgi:hypothetical protein
VGIHGEVGEVKYEAPAVVDYGSISENTFTTVANPGGNIPPKNAPTGSPDNWQECCSDHALTP